MKRQHRYIRILSTLTLALGLLSLSSGDALAKRGKRHKKQRAKIMAQLDLSASQKAELKALRQAHRNEKQAIRQDSSLSKQDKKAKLYSLRKARKAKMQALLSSEQLAQHRSLRAAHKAKKRSQRLARLSDKLALNTQQQAQISEVLDRAAQRGQGIHSQSGLSFQEHKAQVKAHRKQTRSEINDVLNAEQQERFAQMKKDRKRKKNKKGKRRGGNKRR